MEHRSNPGPITLRLGFVRQRISRAHFPKSYFFPEGMSSAHSDALFPPPELAAVIGQEYEEQCRMLCYGAYSSWDEVQARFLELRNLL